MTLNLDHLKQIAQNAKPFVLHAGVAPASVSISADTLTALITRIEELEVTIQRVRELHVREVIAVHEVGEEAWCPMCQQHYPCPTIQALEGDLSCES